MIIKDSISIGNTLCPSCGRQLAKMDRLIMTKENKLLCEDCYERSPMRDKSGQSFAVVGGEALPILDHEVFDRIADSSGKTVFCSNVSDRKGRLALSNTENNAVLVIELPDKVKRDLPQYALIQSNPDLGVQTNFAQRINRKVIVRDSRSSKRKYVFFKTDSPEQTLSMKDEIRDAIIGAVGYIKRTVYMERMANDTNDTGKLLLAGLECPCVYFDGIACSNFSDRRFRIDFTAAELYDYCRRRIIGQDEQLRTAVFLIMDHIEKAAVGSLDRSANWILTAPSGSGKTEFFRAIRDFFRLHGIPVPVLCEDLSQLTETGYKGKDSSSIIEHISNATNADIGNAAICFLDEADKKMTPSFDGRGNNCNALAQGNLLVMLDGGIAEYSKENNTFDTSHTMFILLGAFQELRDEKQLYGEMLDEIGIDGEEIGNSADQFYGDISINEMIRFGMREELAGRLKTVVNFRKPDHESMKAIIRSKCELLAKEYSCNTVLTEEGVDDFIKAAYTNIGIRGITNKMTDLLIKKLAENILTKEFDRERDTLIISGTDSISVRKNEEEAEILPF